MSDFETHPVGTSQKLARYNWLLKHFRTKSLDDRYRYRIQIVSKHESIEGAINEVMKK